MKINERKLYIKCAKKGWDYSTLAEKMNVSYVNFINMKKRNVRPTTIAKLAETLGCEIEELLE